MPRYTAVLDACVLVPITLADTLLRIAEKDLYRPLWSDLILPRRRKPRRRSIRASTSSSASRTCAKRSMMRW
jgi:hypothetical protein